MTATAERTDAHTLARLAELGAATIYEANGQIGAMDAGLRPLDATSTLAGRAVTLDLAPADNCNEVVGHVPDGLSVVKVSTFAEARSAVEAIAAHKGDALPRCTDVAAAS